MDARMWAIALTGMVITMGSGTRAEAQISGRVIFEEGPIGVDVVFGSRPRVVVEYGRTPRYEGAAPRYESRRPVRWRRGMSVFELERYLDWIEAEYHYFRRLHPYDAYDLYGWTEYELDRYVDWLKDERKFLRHEHERLTRRHPGHHGRGARGRGRGRGPRGRGPGR